MKTAFTLIISLLTLAACRNKSADSIAQGQMPNLAKDNSGAIHLVYGNGDSILYSHSTDNGKSFSSSSVVAIIPQLAASHMRGPQIAATSNGLLITACNKSGNIFSFTKAQSGTWSQSVRVNDVDTMAKENLMALAAEGNNAFAVWLDLRDGRNRIYGAKSVDGGKSWSKNILIYASPDSSVCECCKPSVAIRANNVYVMFRNWLGGNRDLYLIHSSDGGNYFAQAEKLGSGSWPLNGCPMDGGSFALNDNGTMETVWNRKGNIYACEPGKEEQKLGEGKNCTMESVNGKNVYAWVENGNVVLLKPQGMKISLGTGELPVLRGTNNEHVLCVWENEKGIQKAIVEL